MRLAADSSPGPSSRPTTVNSAPPSATSACVRRPAGFPCHSRLIPMAAPNRAAIARRPAISQVDCGTEMASTSCQSRVLPHLGEDRLLVGQDLIQLLLIPQEPIELCLVSLDTLLIRQNRSLVGEDLSLVRSSCISHSRLLLVDAPVLSRARRGVAPNGTASHASAHIFSSGHCQKASSSNESISSDSGIVRG